MLTALTVTSSTRHHGEVEVKYQVERLYDGKKLVGFRLTREDGNVYLVDCQKCRWLYSCCDFHVLESECWHAKFLRKHFKLENSRQTIAPPVRAGDPLSSFKVSWQ